MPSHWCQARSLSVMTVDARERRACVPHAGLDSFRTFGAPGSYASRSSGVTMSSLEPRRRCCLFSFLGRTLASASPYPPFSSLTQGCDLAVGATCELLRSPSSREETLRGATFSIFPSPRRMPCARR